MPESIEIMLGRLDGRLEGIAREIKDIKDIIKCDSVDCTTCRQSIYDRIDAGKEATDALAQSASGERAIATWWDSTITKLCIIIGVILGILGFAWDVMR